MSESDLIEVLDRLSPRIPVTADLWSTREVAAYLKYTVAQTRDRIVTQPTFPEPIRIRTGSGRGQPRWKAIEVMQWAEGQRG